jgi:hypothetical protein
MNTIRTLVLALTLSFAGMTVAADNNSGISHEVLGSWLTLPEDATGQLVVKACSSCSTRTFRISRYLVCRIGETEVSYAVMRAAIQARPGALLAFQESADGREVIVFYGAPDLLAN